MQEFPEGYIERLLHPHYAEKADMVDNLCECVLSVMARYILIRKPLGAEGLLEEDDMLMKHRLEEMELEEVKGELREALKKFTESYCENSMEVFSYLTNAVDNVAVRIVSH